MYHFPWQTILKITCTCCWFPTILNSYNYSIQIALFLQTGALKIPPFFWKGSLFRNSLLKIVYTMSMVLFNCVSSHETYWIKSTKVYWIHLTSKFFTVFIMVLGKFRLLSLFLLDSTVLCNNSLIQWNLRTVSGGRLHFAYHFRNNQLNPRKFMEMIWGLACQ